MKSWKAFLIIGVIAVAFVALGTKMVPSGYKSGLWDPVTITGVIGDSLDSLRTVGLVETTNDDSIPYPIHIQIIAPLVSSETGDTLNWEPDTTGGWVFGTAHIVTSAETDSGMATIKTIVDTAYYLGGVAAGDTATVLRSEMPDTLTANAVREIAGRFATALGLGTRDTFFITYGASSADTTFFLETGDSTLMWSNTPNPWRIGPNAIKIATDGKTIFGVSAFHINTDADSTLPSIYWVRTEIGDTAGILRGNISDSLWAHLDDSIGVVRGNIGDTAGVLRGNISDSLWAHLDDSIGVVRGNIGDTAGVLRGNISDSLWAHLDDSIGVVRGNIGDTATVLRGNINDSLWTHLDDSISTVRGNIGDTADVVRGNIPDTITAAVARSITGEWLFTDGLIISGGDTLVIRDGTGADSALIYDTGDSTIFESDNPMRLGTSSVIIPASGPVIISSATVAGGADFEDTLAVDTVLLATKIRLVEASAGTAAIEHLDGTSPLLAVGNTTQSGASGISVVDGGADEPGYICLFTQAGSGMYAWFDDANILHVHTAGYGADPEGTGYKLIDADDGQLYNKGLAVPNNDVFVRAYLSGGDQAIGDGAWTQIQFNAKVADIGSDFNTGTYEFVAPDSGYYVVSARALIDDNGGTDQDGYSSIGIYRNDSLKCQGPMLAGQIYGGTDPIDMTALNAGPSVTATIYCAVNDQIQIYGYQSFDSGGGLIIDDEEKTWVTIRKAN